MTNPATLIILSNEHPGTALSVAQFKELLDLREGDAPFVFPPDRLLKIKGYLSQERLSGPDMHDGDMIVMKDGNTTDLTFGRSGGLDSYFCDEHGHMGVGLAIYNYGKGFNGVFAAMGDSGSLIFNRNGEMVGLIHAAKAKVDTGATTITYGIPAWRLLDWIKEVYPNADFDCETW